MHTGGFGVEHGTRPSRLVGPQIAILHGRFGVAVLTVFVPGFSIRLCMPVLDSLLVGIHNVECIIIVPLHLTTRPVQGRV